MQPNPEDPRRRPPEQVVVVPPGADRPSGDESAPDRESVEQPAKVLRIGSMIKQLLDEVRQAPLDEASRTRLREIYDMSVNELASGLSGDLQAELERMTSPFGPDEVPSEAELRVAQAQLVGWLEGLFHGIQATLFAQQMAARAQLEQMRQRGLPAPADQGLRPGQYL
jgi:hypothetical protein